MKKIKKNNLSKAQKGKIIKKITAAAKRKLDNIRKKKQKLNTNTYYQNNANVNPNTVNPQLDAFRYGIPQTGPKSGIFNTMLDAQLPSMRQTGNFIGALPGATYRGVKNNPVSTAAIAIGVAAYLKSGRSGIEEVPTIQQFDVNPNFSNKYKTNTLSDTIKSTVPIDFDREGGSIKSKSGKIAPGMKKGGGLKLDRNGKFYRK
mgnify:CR=1 FL=1